MVDEFDDWPISDEEIVRFNIHVNDHPRSNCEICQENDRKREELRLRAEGDCNG